jgi:hypothetical protein
MALLSFASAFCPMKAESAPYDKQGGQVDDQLLSWSPFVM